MLSVKYIRYIFATVTLLICMAFVRPVNYGVDPPVVKVLSGSAGQLKVDSVIMVEDAKFFSGNPNLIKPYRVQNMVSLEVNEFSMIPVQDSFTVTARLLIKKTDAQEVVTQQTVDLTVRYNKDSSYEQRRTILFTNAYRVEVKVISLSKTVAWDAYAQCKVVNHLQAFPEYQFDCTTNAVQAITANTTDVVDELPVSWATAEGADEYDLEWTYLDTAALNDGMYGTPLSPDAALIFANNASRVTVTGTSYRIPLFYDRVGKLFFRVRSVHRPAALGAQGGRIEANWSSGFSGGLGVYAYAGHEKKLNWQSSTSFAEEGKRKTVMQYYDGSLRARQTVTKDNVSEKTIVAESMYDFQGRPVVQVLPAPSLGNAIKYARNFNRAVGFTEYEKNLYDTLPDPTKYCEQQAVPMASDTGASRYYSPNNQFLSAGDRKYSFIPDAELFPFTEVEYTQDNTGRVTRQSGVGKAFRMGSGKETIYSYGTPDQRELDALFGTEVGLATHYQKTVVTDANGQSSISYSDMRGRTIATALTGSLTPGAKLDTLASMIKEARTESLSDPSTAVLRDLVMESTRGLEVTDVDSVLHNFEYKLTPESIQLEDCNNTEFCYDCLYDLEITITSNCNNCNLPGKQPYYSITRNFSFANIDTTCTPAQAFNLNFSLWLKKGSYVITKKLSVNRAAMDYYRDSLFMRRNHCYTIDSFANEYRKLNPGAGNCAPACEGCLENVGNWETYWTNYKNQYNISGADTANHKDVAMRAHTEAIEACNALCGNRSEKDDIRNAMLMDMTPPMGQYANIEKDEQSRNIFYINGATKPAYQRATGYKDASGRPAMIYRELTGTLVPPEQLTVDEFIANFQPSWAETLLPFHPEYRHLEKFTLLEPSHEWDRKVEEVSTYAVAKQKGYLNPTGAATIPFSYFSGTGTIENDPLSTLQGGIFKPAIETAINSYLGSVNLYGFVSMSVLCNNMAPATCETLYASGQQLGTSTTICDGDRNMAWQTFRSIYLSWKKMKIETWIKDQFPGASTADSLLSEGYFPNFSTTSLFSSLPQDSSATTKNNMAQQARNYYDSNCEAYARYWLKTLSSSCTLYDTNDLKLKVIPELIAVCKQGADIDHPYGSSTVAPSSTYKFRSFEEVIRNYNRLKAIDNNNCNPYVIVSPRPYDQQVANSTKPVVQKPSDCECSLINEYNQKFLGKTNQYRTFGEFMRTAYKTSITDSTADLLLGLCNNTSTCTYLSGPILLPPAFQCNTGDICIDCTLFTKYDSSFRVAYPDMPPSADLTYFEDSTQQSWNRLYENYMNFKTGFVKTAKDYLEFAYQCQGISRSPGCDSLNSILLRYKIQRKLVSAIKYLRGYWIEPTTKIDLTNPGDIVRNGVLMLPDTVRASTGTGYVGDRLTAINPRAICFPQGFAFEFRFKLLGPVTDGALFYSIAGVFGGTFTLTPQGVKLIQVTSPDQGVVHNTDIIANANRNVIYDWCTVKYKTTISQIYVYFNDVLVFTAARNPDVALPFYQLMASDFRSRMGAIDWYKLYDHNGDLRYFEDFNNLNGYSFPDESIYCTPTVTNWKTSFTTYFNSKNGNSSLTYDQIVALYLQKCGKLPDLGYNDETDKNAVLNIVKNFNETVTHNRGVPAMMAESLTVPDSLVMDRPRIQRDGIMMWEDRLHKKTAINENTIHRFSAPPGTSLCAGQGYSVEMRFKMAADLFPASSDLFEIGDVNGGFRIARNSSGTYISAAWIKNGATVTSFTPTIPLSSRPDLISVWTEYKVEYAGDSMKIYVNGVPKGLVRLTGKVMTNIEEVHLKSKGYKGMVDWTRIRNSKGMPVYFEDFNNPDYAAFFDPSFICSVVPDCETTFVNYYNLQRGSSYTFRQIDSIYFSKTGKSLDVCGAKDSLINLVKRYRRDQHPYRVSAEHYLNDASWAGSPYFRMTNKETSFENGIFRWPDTIRNAGTFESWWLYSNLVANGGSFCAGSGFAVEGRVRLMKDNFQPIVENFNINIDNNFTLVLYKSSHVDNPYRGLSITRIMVKQHPDSPANYNLLQGQTYLISPDPSFLSKQWHTFKVKMTATQLIFHWNGVEICRANRPPAMVSGNFSAINTGFMGSQGAIDWYKVYNHNDEVMLHETFDDPIQRSLIHPDMLCPKPVYNCQSSFTSWFNLQKGTGYSFAKIDSVYHAMTGSYLSVCSDTTSAPPPNYTLCGRSEPGFPEIAAVPIDGCSDSTVFIQGHAQLRYQFYQDSLRGAFDSAYTAKCMNAYKFESFTVRRTVQEYHYTLYYYDQAGNLVKTIPPAGVRPNRDSLWLNSVAVARKNRQVVVPAHLLPTDYRYNGLNQVVAQKSPDGGKSRFWYDRLGRLVISQNAKQKYASATEESRLYSYTKYDVLGRITEVGQLKNLATNGAMLDTTSRTPSLLDTWMTALNQRREQITSTVYDLPYPGFTGVFDDRQIVQQRNLRNRVSYTTYSDGWNTANYNQGSFYTYDIHGNVDTLLQDYGCGSCGITGVPNIMNQNGNRFKKISYNYDLISGKVNSVAYQKGWTDQFFHKYSYDGENRLTLVETSLDGYTWESDARYEYYLHGPLARTVLGTQQVQGLDYAYTIQGWLKGINSSGATAQYDIGSDGRLPSGGTVYGNQYVARDAFGFALNYFDNDYKPVSTTVDPFPGYSAYLNTEFRPLYNGNISSMVSTNRVFENAALYPDSATMLFNYRYDQLNRITGMDVYNKFNRNSNSFSALTRLDKFKERVSYDPNGNILKYLRNGDGNGNTAHLRMDSLQYNYYARTNRLRSVRDSVPASWYGANATDKIVDIDNQVDTDNYIYDSIGNLIQDKAEQITSINWNVYGKITGISRDAGTQVPASEISYTYDASGNRISKSVEKGGRKTITWYVRDAQGNVMATYSSDAPAATPLPSFALIESERYIYGSSRLGVVTVAQAVDNGNAGPAAVVDTGGAFLRGERMYELSNHLGNVLVTISDKKKGIADPILSSLISHFEPIMLSGTDYYPFGMPMRVGGDNKYRFGFNGQEKSNEIKGEGNSYTAEFWEYDPRLGRRWNVDPATKHYEGSYVSFANNPLRFVDPNGADTFDVKSRTIDFMGRRLGQKGFNPAKMMTLFTARDHETHLTPTGERIEFRREMASNEFLKRYTLNESLPFQTIYSSERKESHGRIPVSVLSVNNNAPNFSQVVNVVGVDDFESIRREAVSAVRGRWISPLNNDKMALFGHGKEYDIKANLLRISSLTYVNNVGLFESDYLGNLVYGSIMSNFQSLSSSLNDGDMLQDKGYDDVSDSHAIIIGHFEGKSRISINTFRKISRYTLEKFTTIQGKVYSEYNINNLDTGQELQLKTNN